MVAKDVGRDLEDPQRYPLEVDEIRFDLRTKLFDGREHGL